MPSIPYVRQLQTNIKSSLKSTLIYSRYFKDEKMIVFRGNKEIKDVNKNLFPFHFAKSEFLQPFYFCFREQLFVLLAHWSYPHGKSGVFSIQRYDQLAQKYYNCIDKVKIKTLIGTHASLNNVFASNDEGYIYIVLTKPFHGDFGQMYILKVNMSTYTIDEFKCLGKNLGTSTILSKVDNKIYFLDAENVASYCLSTHNIARKSGGLELNEDFEGSRACVSYKDNTYCFLYDSQLKVLKLDKQRLEWETYSEHTLGVNLREIVAAIESNDQLLVICRSEKGGHTTIVLHYNCIERSLNQIVSFNFKSDSRTVISIPDHIFY